MRHEKIAKILMLARALAASAEGMTLDEMAAFLGESRSSADRSRRIIGDLFPALQEIPEHPQKRFRIPNGLDSFFQDPTAEELACLDVEIGRLVREGATDRVGMLRELDRKIRSAMRLAKRTKTEPDVEALVRAELIAVQAGPRATEDPAMLGIIREGLLGMRLLHFTYFGGSTPGAARDVIPLGILFGRCNYLIAVEAGTTKPKSWRLDRIENLRVLDTPGIPPHGFSLTNFANDLFGFFDEKPQDVILYVLPAGMDDLKNFRFHASQAVETLPSGGALVRFRASGMQELVWHLFSWGNKVEIIEPVSLRQSMTSDLTVTLAHHREPLRYVHTVNRPGTAA
jgi:predicted DNA-binding transcriptional regulator YafY